MTATQPAISYYKVFLVSNLEINLKQPQNNNLELGIGLKSIRRIPGLHKQRNNQVETPKESRIS